MLEVDIYRWENRFLQTKVASHFKFLLSYQYGDAYKVLDDFKSAPYNEKTSHSFEAIKYSGE